MEQLNRNSLGILGRTDSYKFGGHWNMLKDGTTFVSSYLESRGGLFPKTLWVGIQGILKDYLVGCVVTPEQVERAYEFSKFHLGEKSYFNYDGWMYIATELKGKLPIRIKSAKEGSLIGVSNVLMTIENTDEKCQFVVGYLESLIMKVWYPTTIATNGFYLKLLLKKYYNETSDETDLSFKMHDFSYRSVTTEEQSGIGSFAHLVNFLGTDSIQGILYSDEMYNSGINGFSVNATEHAIATPFGREGEKEYVMTILKKYPKGILSMVADSYDIYAHAEMLCNDVEIRENILARDGVYVVRPDSGDPVTVISKLLNILWKGFGGEYNSKGYKVLNPKIRIIQGDGINMQSIKEILDMMKANGYSTCNLVFGAGSALLNKGFDRDTQQFAFKTSFNIINGKKVLVQKDPITSSSKKSKIGKLKLYKNYDDTFTTISSVDLTDPVFNGYVDFLEIVFENGELKKIITFDEVKNEASKYIDTEYPIYMKNFDEFFKKTN